MLPGRAVVPICCGLVFLQPLLRAHARLRQLVGPRSSRSSCQPTALQRPPRQMTDRKSDRGRDGGFVAHGAPKKTAAAWNPRPEDPSGVSRDQAGRPSKARGIGLLPRILVPTLVSHRRRTVRFLLMRSKFLFLKNFYQFLTTCG